jgi:hypothetical protein
MRISRTRWHIAVCCALLSIGVAGCSQQDPPNQNGQYAVVGEKGPTTAFIIAGRQLSADDVELIVIDGATNFGWVRVEIPTALVTGGPTVVDLTDPATQVVFAQSYLDACNPADAQNTRRCWLRERYLTGDLGLTGRLTIQQTSSGLDATYDVYWEGTTERFEGPPQWHGHGSSGTLRVSSENVRQVSL